MDGHGVHHLGCRACANIVIGPSFDCFVVGVALDGLIVGNGHWREVAHVRRRTSR